jgi:hypothetical protein
LIYVKQESDLKLYYFPGSSRSLEALKMQRFEVRNLRSARNLGYAKNLRVADLRKRSQQHRKAAEDFLALAEACQNQADKIMYSEYVRREIETAESFERCADRYK